MTDFLYPSWQKPYQEALLEFEPEKLKEKIIAAESAIFLRFRELAGVNGQATDERRALNDALHALSVLRLEPHYPKLRSQAAQTV